MSSSENNREKPMEIMKASDVVATAHAQGLLVTFSYEEDRHVQVVMSRELALRMARDILNVMYNMGMKVE